MANISRTALAGLLAAAILVARDPVLKESREAARMATQLTDRTSTVAQAGESSQGLEFWESEDTRTKERVPSADERDALADRFAASFHTYMEYPFLPLEEVRRAQFARIQELVTLAYERLPVYRQKYDLAGFSPADLRDWSDFERIPPITKAELIDAFPDGCLNPQFPRDDLFRTKSSGSSGQTLLIRVNFEAILKDTIQGVQQFVLQSGLQYQPDALLAHIYTVPWWFHEVGGQYQTAFISSLIPVQHQVSLLREMRPAILSCYPSNLEALLPLVSQEKISSLNLVVVHSEQSSRVQRDKWSSQLGVPVRDEYSSEEATRIAIELPCGHYHVTEDAVYLEVLDPETLAPQLPGTPGIAVVTNLLNEAMPFIRYVQGDYVSRPHHPHGCSVQWSQVESIGGRANDSFRNRHGVAIPSGTILDVTYRWMSNAGIHLREFEVIQERPDHIRARFQPGAGMEEAHLRRSTLHLRELLEACMEHPVHVDIELVERFPQHHGKKRPIRREFRF